MPLQEANRVDEAGDAPSPAPNLTLYPNEHVLQREPVRDEFIPSAMHRLQTLIPIATREQFLAVCEELLLVEPDRIPFERIRQWAGRFPPAPGIYAIFELGELAYVGESGSLRGRMSDLFDTRHHTLRRSLGEERFGGLTGFTKASSKLKFPLHIEERLMEHMVTSLSVRAIELTFGRREVEEHMIAKYQPPFNLKAQRR